MLSNEIVIDVKNISKRYEIYEKPRDRLKQLVLPTLHRIWSRLSPLHTIPPQYFREFWALRNVTFQVKRGETVGIIGRNGSGKSTLLQLICGTLSPTSGDVVVTGRISALLELGSGFNPEYTGRENVFMNGQILGLSQKEIESKYEAIIKFANIGDFIERPVKTYSSGMTVRLAFAVAINVDPIILIIDEALAVGDMNFQAKCMTALARIQEQGTTVLFVSHSIDSVKSLCSKGVFLEHGKVQAFGPASDVAAQFTKMMREEKNSEYLGVTDKVSSSEFEEVEGKGQQVKSKRSVSTDLKLSEEFDERVSVHRYGSGEAQVSYVELLNMNDEPISVVEFNQEIQIRIYCKVKKNTELGISFQILDAKQNNITWSGLVQAGGNTIHAQENYCYITTFKLKLPLRADIYSIQIQLAKPFYGNTSSQFLDVIPNAVVFRMMSKAPHSFESAVFLFPSVEVEEINV
jgi:lipopolysaccharide transport system ATP-binding protein